MRGLDATLPFYRSRLIGWLAAATVTGAAAQALPQQQPFVQPSALAQPQPQPQALAAPKAHRPDPPNPQAEVPATVHVSAFATYRAAGEPQVGGWKEANDTVARMGGWRAYAREATAPTPAVVAPAAAAAASRSPAGKPGQPGHSGRSQP